MRPILEPSGLKEQKQCRTCLFSNGIGVKRSRMDFKQQQQQQNIQVRDNLGAF